MCRIKIIQLITGLDVGGAERMLIELCRGLDKAVFDVRLASLSSRQGGLAIYGSPDVPLEFFDLRDGNWFKNLLKLRAWIRAVGPDLIHAHMFHGLVGALAGVNLLRPKPALCFTSHSGRLPLTRSILVRGLKYSRAADVIFSPGQHFSLNAPHTVVIPNGIPVAQSVPERQAWDPSQRVRFISIGSLRAPKDPLGLIRAFTAANLPNARLDLVGAGPLENAARQLVIDLGIASRVIFRGLQSDVRACLRDADIFVMHSAWEGMPLAVLEAGAEGMPVVSTPVGSVPEILGDNCGWISSTDSFAQTMRYVAANPQIALQYGARLFHRIREHYSVATCVQHHAELYRRLCRLDEAPKTGAFWGINV